MTKKITKLMLNGQEYEIREYVGPQNWTSFDFTTGTLPTGVTTTCSLTSDGLGSPGETYASIDGDITGKTISRELTFYEGWVTWSDVYFLVSKNVITAWNTAGSLAVEGLQGYDSPGYKGGLGLDRYDSVQTGAEIINFPAGNDSVFANLPAGIYTIGASYDFTTGNYHLYMLDDNGTAIIDSSGTFADNANVVSNVTGGQQYYIGRTTGGYSSTTMKSMRYTIS